MEFIDHCFCSCKVRDVHDSPQASAMDVRPSSPLLESQCLTLVRSDWSKAGQVFVTVLAEYVVRRTTLLWPTRYASLVHRDLASILDFLTVVGRCGFY